MLNHFIFGNSVPVASGLICLLQPIKHNSPNASCKLWAEFGEPKIRNARQNVIRKCISIDLDFLDNYFDLYVTHRSKMAAFLYVKITLFHHLHNMYNLWF